MLGTTKDKVPRYRDCYLDAEQKRLVIYTRTGGGNRDSCEDEETCRENYPEYFQGNNPKTGPWNSDLRALPNYIYDKDEEFDSTYANFYFSFPQEYENELVAMCNGDVEFTPSEKWKRLLSSFDEAKA